MFPPKKRKLEEVHKLLNWLINLSTRLVQGLRIKVKYNDFHHDFDDT